MISLIFKINRDSEKGIFIPLSAVLGAALLSLLLIYAVETITVRRASSALSLINKEVCSLVAREPTIHRRIIPLFQQQINDRLLHEEFGDLTLTAARLIAPTFPAEGTFCFPDIAECSGLPGDITPEKTGKINFGSISAAVISDATAWKCNLECGAASECDHDCKFMGNLAETEGYPPTMWSNLENAGNVVGCELEGEHRSLFGHTRMLRTKEVLHKRLRGIFPNYDPLNPPTDFQTRISTFPGLSVVFSPHMRTNANLPQFRMHSNLFNAMGIPNGDQIYDPLAKWPEITTSLFSQQPPSPRIFNLPGHVLGSYNLEIPRAISSGCSHEDGNGICEICTGPHDSEQCRDLNGTAIGTNYGDHNFGCEEYNEFVTLHGRAPYDGDPDCINVSDREQMISSCLSLPIMVRNAFMGTLFNLLQRNADTRRNTELLIPGTRGFHLEDNWEPQSMSKYLSNPVRLIPLGQDLADPDGANHFQFPYMTTFLGNDIEPASPFIGSQDLFGKGLVNPISTGHQANGLPQDTAYRQYHAILSAQMRTCFHLFQGESTGVEMPDVPLVSGDHNWYFEPSNAYGFDSTFRTTYPGSNAHWDQDCGLENTCTHSSTSRNLTSSEIVSSFGALQLCPYEAGGMPIFDDSLSFDSDGDGVPDGIDNCPADPNPDQIESDDPSDGIGDDCQIGVPDDDQDDDLVLDHIDNCPNDGSSADQTDTDNDGIGDLCDPHSALGSGICFKPKDGSMPPSPFSGLNPDKWPTEVGKDLKPDLYATLEYLANGDPKSRGEAYPAYIGKSNGAAIPVPPKAHAGIAPPMNDLNPYAADPYRPYGLDSYYEAASNPDTSVLIFTSTPLMQDERDAIADLMTGDSSPFKHRLCTMIYFDIFSRSLIEFRKIEYDFQKAFNDLNTGLPADGQSGCRVLTFSPFNALVDKSHTNFEDWNAGNLVFLPTDDFEAWERYQMYWEHLLKDPKHNIWNAASNIFNYRIHYGTVYFEG